MTKLWTNDEVLPFLTAWRRGFVTRVVDGDTLDLRIDLGFDVQVETRIRLMNEGLVEGLNAGVDAWETRGAEREMGLEAKARTVELCQGKTCRVFSAKGGSRGKYGRWLAVILYPVEGGWRSLGDTLVEEGHAEAKSY